MEKWKSRFRTGRSIGILSMIIFLIVAISMVFSSYYMNISITAEEDAQTRRIKFRQQGENLADASDYLTEQVRYYAITGNIEHFYNYWYEIHESQQREHAIADFESSNPPVKERKLLEEAKKYSDLLVETETYSMKMMLTVMGITANAYPENESMTQYIEQVMAYEWTKETDALSSEQMRQKAIDILYDENYENYKEKIMTPIENFQMEMNDRLNQEVEERKAATRTATVVQIVLAMVSLAGVAFILNLMNCLYINPLKKYTQEMNRSESLEKREYSSEDSALEILDAKIIPYGAKELVQFAEAFNHLIDRSFQELCNRKNAEENMRVARNEAQMANQAKSAFLAQMSHELRTPLNAIDGYIDMLESTPLEEQQRTYVKNIRYSSNGLLNMINQILDFSRIESGHLELEEIDFEMRELLMEVQGVMENQAYSKGLYLNMEVDENIPDMLRGDPLRIRQLLLNLIGNAVKFTPKGGITVRLQMEKRKETMCQIRFDVIDTGIGVKEEAKKRIFQPFMQSDSSVTRRYGGTGLGLPICSQLVMLFGDHSHRMHLISREGEGADFFFKIDFMISPLEKTECNQITDMAKNTIPDFTGRKIMVVDDTLINIQVETAILELSNATVETALSGNEALQKLARISGIELILLDIRMPDMDGYETAQRIRQIEGYEKVPIVALTADAMGEVQRKAKETGMDSCLLKPVSQFKLFEMLRKYLREAKHLSGKTCDGAVSNQHEDKEQEDTVFNQEQFLRQLGGNEQAMISIIESFLGRHKADQQLLWKAIDKQEYAKAENIIHTLKGLLGNMYCTPLYLSCCSLQEELRGNKYDEYDNFKALWLETCEKLGKVMQRFQVHQLHSEHLKSRNEKEEGAIMEEIIRLSESCDTGAILLLEQYRKQLQILLGEEKAEQLKQYGMSYDFDGILGCVK